MLHSRFAVLASAAALLIAVTHILIAPGRAPDLADRVAALEAAVYGTPRQTPGEMPAMGLGRAVRDLEVTAKVQGGTIDVLWGDRPAAKPAR